MKIKLGNYNVAEEYLRMALSLTDSNEEKRSIYSRLRSLFEAKGQIDEAEEWLSEKRKAFINWIFL